MHLPINSKVASHGKALLDPFLQCVYASSQQPHFVLEFLDMKFVAKFYSCSNDYENQLIGTHLLHHSENILFVFQIDSQQDFKTSENIQKNMISFLKSRVKCTEYDHP